MIEMCFDNLNKNHYAPPTNLFKTLFFFYLSPKELLIVKRFNKAALTLLLDTITINYKRAIVTPGEMVGMIAGQSIGEVSTQMTLNTFHFAGVASKSNVTRGVPRIEEILSLSSDIKNPSLSIYLKPEDEKQKEKAQTIMYMLEHTRLEEIVKSIEVCFDPDDLNTLISEDKDTIQQYRAFENMVSECNEISLQSDENEKSK
jgi:DNA-directed RNA polymerase II subunit RPB1